MKTLLLPVAALIVMVSGLSAAQVYLHQVDGMMSNGSLGHGTVVFRFAFDNTSGCALSASKNAFRFVSGDGAEWSWGPNPGAWLPSVESQYYDNYVDVFTLSFDGLGADSILFQGARTAFSGIPKNFSGPVFTVTMIVPASSAGKTIVLQKCDQFFAGQPSWVWTKALPCSGTMEPTWSGSYFFDVYESCGDVNGDGSYPNIADLTHFVAYLFGGGPDPVPGSANVNGEGTVNIADLTYFVAYLFGGGPDLNCP